MTLKEIMEEDLNILIDPDDFAESMIWVHDRVEKEIFGIVDVPFEEAEAHDTKVETSRREVKVKSSAVIGIARDDKLIYDGIDYYVYRFEPENPGFTILFLSKDKVYADP